ncbi:MAG: Ppx/GppA phosphatase family protein [Acidimicrobiales bacterium]
MRIAALDLGSNSFHLLVVDAHPDGSFVPILREKEMLRLGDLVSREGRIPERAKTAAVESVARFRALAESSNSEELVACATSAIREADNGGELVDCIYAQTGVRVRVISGREEARLIFRAIRSSIRINPAPALCFDLGGGSLEVMVGDHDGLLWSTSVKLGVARLAAELVQDDPLSADDMRRLKERLTATLTPVAETLAEFQIGMAVGTSGTFGDLARMVAAKNLGAVPPSINQLAISREEVRALNEELVGLSSAERTRLPGLEARRADLVPVGSQLLLSAMELFGFDELTVGEWALREGIVLDAIGHHELTDWSGDSHDIRLSSVLNLARRCNWEEVHSRRVAELAMAMFDQTARLHQLGAEDRELLFYAGLLHDIGQHVSTESHHKHTAYLIQHGRLKGFDPEEVDALAALTRYHRRSEPKGSHEPYALLPPTRQERVAKLAALLRIADGLDCGHSGAVEGIDVEIDDERVRILLQGNDVDLELWGGRRKRGLFERLFARRVCLGATS